jgi:hypothetical protein
MGDGILNRLRAGAVGLNGFAVPPKRLYLIGDRLGFIGGFFIRNNHIGTGARQRQAIARPNPRLAPVTSAFLPVKSICMMTSLRESGENHH